MKRMLKLYNSLGKRQDIVGSICVKLFQMDNHFMHMSNHLGIDICSTLLVGKVSMHLCLHYTNISMIPAVKKLNKLQLMCTDYHDV